MKDERPDIRKEGTREPTFSDFVGKAFKDEAERLKSKMKTLLPDDCIVEGSEIKLCPHRLGDGNVCKHCAD